MAPWPLLPLCLVIEVVTLSPEQRAAWLPPETSPEMAYDTIALARQDFEVHPVTTDVGNPRNQGDMLNKQTTNN